ncbi:MAG: acetyl-CoA carboxylase biotin carboxylase subunit [Candidatus Cloacimonadota bacterium]|nr:MAG: acetyl-CoA carboxylase biotin carboxylase subunit [Candidatus Cloacimonadota bacterium]
MFKRVLIANRGEIALRIIRACQESGIETVSVHSEADEDSLHVRFSDQSVCIGPPESQNSYLSAKEIISACLITNCEAIHPGYGFLAENPQFAEMCESNGIKFIGPPFEIIRKMGDKVYAKREMEKAGIPVIPGSKEPVLEVAQGLKIAKDIGFPVMIKAAFGGGGKGMRIVNIESEFNNFFKIAQTEAETAFGEGTLYIEKFIKNPRHIEFQILADNYGNTIHLGERECSIQRRHQKLLEESPSKIVDEKIREKIGALAVKGMKKIGYKSAGTVEFIFDRGKFFFMEMNTRIQVEHPVTEFVTGVDLLKEQIRIASGEKLSFSQKDIKVRGCAIEARINAEDPENNFLPSIGKIDGFHIPGGPGIRVDTHLYSGYTIPRYYDSLIAKLISYGKDREEAITRLRRALKEFVIEGIKTTIPFHLKLLDNKDFISGNIHTGLVNEML